MTADDTREALEALRQIETDLIEDGMEQTAAAMHAPLDAIEAAIRGTEAGLDVERLRYALVRADEAMGERYPETFPLDLTNTGWPRFAAAIAAEYARLASADSEPS